jgi:Sulfotransferase domain
MVGGIDAHEDRTGMTATDTLQNLALGKDDLGKGPFRTDGRLIVSYPKSGRTWLRYALTEAGLDVTITHAGASTNRREIGLPFRGIPKSLESLPLIFLHRDPLDTAVSMFYQINRRDLRPGSGRWFRMWLPLMLKRALPPQQIDDFVLHPLYGIDKVCQYNRAWLDHLTDREDCQIITYEEMRADPALGFSRLLDFWQEKRVSGAELAELSSFEKMKAVEKAQTGPAVRKSAPSDDPSAAKVRKGKVGGYRDELRQQTIAQCHAIAATYGFSQGLVA